MKSNFLSILAISLCLLSAQAPARAAEVVVDASRIQGPFRNIAGGVNFWGSEEAQSRFIEEVGADLYRLKIRLHRVQKVAKSYTNFPWEGDDLTLEEIKAIVGNMRKAQRKGCKIMLQIYGVPSWLSLAKDRRVVTNNLPDYAKYPPRDYGEWTKLVSSAIRELHKIGLEQIDYYEIFGEPNAGSTWYAQMMPCRGKGVQKRLVYDCRPNELGHNGVQVIEGFLEVYRATVEGIEAVDGDAEIGGIGVIPNPSGIWWSRFVAEYVKSHGLPLAFYSWHWYGVDEALARMLNKIGSNKVTVGLVRRYFEERLKRQGFDVLEINRMILDLHDYLKDLKTAGRHALQYPHTFVSSSLERVLDRGGMDSAKLFLTEWNVSHAMDRRHDTHYGASYIIKGLVDITDSKTKAQSLYVLSNRRLSDHDGGFGGFYGVFTSDKAVRPKASFNALKLFSMLGDDAKRLEIAISEEDVYAIATYDGQDVSVLVTYYRMANEPDYGLSEEMSIEVKDLPFSHFRYTLYRIDRDHGNSYYGAADDLTPTEKGSGEGGFKKSIPLPVYGVLMIRLAPDSQNQ